MRTNRRTFTAAEIKPESELAPLDLALLFGRPAPLEVDLGCGDGTFLVARAQSEPARNFLGVERSASRARCACRKVGDGGLSNALILLREILPAVQQLLPRESVDTFYLLFPDPWPKRRHHDHRVVKDSFLRAVWRALKPEGELIIATDDHEYFEAIERTVATRSEMFALGNEIETATHSPSTFEYRFSARGLVIYRLALRKIVRPERRSLQDGRDKIVA